jgi:vacuolar-type H+-ATPase subunit H
MTSDSGPTVSDVGGLDALKRIKATEAEWDERLSAARRDAEAAIARRHAEAEATVLAVGAEAEAERTRTVDAARAAADAEARTIVANGEAAARSAASSAGKRPQDVEKRLIAAVLGPLGPD